MKTFDTVIESVDATVADIARALRKIIQSAVKGVEENAMGGAKVQLVLYSHGGPGRVICGIGPSGAKCLFYLHRIEQSDIPEYKLTGKGKHAKQIAFAAVDQVDAKVIKRVVKLACDRLAP